MSLLLGTSAHQDLATMEVSQTQSQPGINDRSHKFLQETYIPGPQTIRLYIRRM